MIFGLDIRQRICRLDRKWMDYVDVKSHIKCLVDDEEESNEEIKLKLGEALEIFKEIETLKRQDFTNEVKQFEQDFANEVLANPEWYKN